MIAVDYLKLNDDGISQAGNIIAVLDSEHHDRVCEIKLFNVAHPLLEKIAVAMKKPFPGLTHLSIGTGVGARVPVIPDSFLGGSAQHLRSLLLDHIPIPALPKLLSSANNLVTLEISDTSQSYSGYLSPEAMATGLAAMARLEKFELTFLSTRSRPDPESRRPPPSTRSILPALTQLEYQGGHEYFEDVIAWVEAPFLRKARIIFFGGVDSDVPQLHRFISCAEELRKLDYATVEFWKFAAIITLTLQTTSINHTELMLQVGGRQWTDELVPSMIRVCRSSLLPFSSLDRLDVKDDSYYFSLEALTDSAEWLEFLELFISVKTLYLSEVIVKCLERALYGLSPERVAEVLPTLENVFLWRVEPSGPLQRVIGRFATARELSGNPVAVHNLVDDY